MEKQKFSISNPLCSSISLSLILYLLQKKNLQFFKKLKPQFRILYHP